MIAVCEIRCDLSNEMQLERLRKLQQEEFDIAAFDKAIKELFEEKSIQELLESQKNKVLSPNYISSNLRQNGATNLLNIPAGLNPMNMIGPEIANFAKGKLTNGLSGSLANNLASGITNGLGGGAIALTEMMTNNGMVQGILGNGDLANGVAMLQNIPGASMITNGANMLNNGIGGGMLSKAVTEGLSVITPNNEVTNDGLMSGKILGGMFNPGNLQGAMNMLRRDIPLAGNLHLLGMESPY